ncbi:MAG: hypothetical protein D6761_03800 [Candidatus Dadabacteria bacterium]|nr:MAG: hypothetical protein D6761_03800 [Candidatus Dadabacteria bacterium]
MEKLASTLRMNIFAPMKPANATSHPAVALTQLLAPYVPTSLHPWRLIATTTGALCAKNAIEPADLLGFYTDAPLKLTSANQGLQAIELAAALVDATADALARSAPLLTAVSSPQPGRPFALALADALYGFADGLDLANVDPDALRPDAAALFERLGRRAAATEALADALPEHVDNAVADELRALADQTDEDLRAFWAELHNA